MISSISSYRDLRRRWMEPMIWGQSDCLIEMSRYLMDNGDNDHHSAFIGSYNDEDGAKRIMDEKGNGSLHSTFIVMSNVVPIDYVKGAVAMFTFGGEELIGVANDPSSVVLRGQNGIAVIDTRFLENVNYYWISTCHR